VDIEYVKSPRPWNIDFIKKFMIFIGPVSSLFDYMTFAVMWFVFNATTPAQQAIFNTGWFLESLTSQTLVIYIIRTNKIPFIQSRPSKPLAITTVSILAFAYLFVNSPYGQYFGFTPLPWQFYVILLFMIIVYLALVQIVKNWFIRKYGPA
jgi:Mg2+-importing ATPase